MLQEQTEIQTINPEVMKLPIDYNITDAALADLKKKYQGLTINSSDDHDAVKAGIKELVSTRTSVDKKRKELNADAAAWQKAVNAEAKRITSELESIEIPLKEIKQAYDEKVAKAEAERLAPINERLDYFKKLPKQLEDSSAAEIKAAMDKLQTLIEFDDFDYQELKDRAAYDKGQALIKLTNDYEKAKKIEDQQKEIAEQKRLLAEQAEALRKREAAIAAAEADKAPQAPPSFEPANINTAPIPKASEPKAPNPVPTVSIAIEPSAIGEEENSQSGAMRILDIKGNQIDTFFLRKFTKKVGDKEYSFAININGNSLGVSEYHSGKAIGDIQSIAALMTWADDLIEEKLKNFGAQRIQGILDKAIAGGKLND